MESLALESLRVKSLSAILIDLDGTLTDPAPGIIGSFRHALQTLGLNAPEPESLHWIIGPPLRESFEKVMGKTPQVEDALLLYRERYGAGGMYEATLYAGVEAMLTELRAIAGQLILCTSKPHVFARPILDHFGIRHFFAAVHGSELDGFRDHKNELIAYIMAQENLAADTLCMLGDRLHDVRGAGFHNIPTIGAVWGYGGAQELTEAGAVTLCYAPGDVPAAIRRLCAA